MINEVVYKDRPAVSISNDDLVATFLYLDGAKLVSLKDKSGNEYLAQAEGKKYRRLGIDTNYVDAECSAFDDMFPTIDPCSINGMTYLDHGEVARREHRWNAFDNKLSFDCNLESINIFYQKIVFFENRSLLIKYKIKNSNPFDFPYVFAGHIMLKGECGATVLSAFERDSQKQLMFGDPESAPNVLCEKGSAKEWKYYYQQAKSPLQCSVYYPLSKYRVSLICENDTIKYLGVWMNPGELNKMYSIAIEPCSALYDSPVSAKETCSYIKAGEEIEFTLRINIERDVWPL